MPNSGARLLVDFKTPTHLKHPTIPASRCASSDGKRPLEKNNTKDHDPEQHATSLQPNKLLPFVGNYRQPMPKGIAFHLTDYLELVDWTGRAVLQGKGSVDTDTPKILQRLSISPKHWIELSTNFESRFKGIVCTTESLKALCSMFGLSRNANRSNSRLLFS